MKGIKTMGLVALLALALLALPSAASAATDGVFKAGAYPAALTGTATWGIHFESPVMEFETTECEPTSATGELSKLSETMTVALSSSEPLCWPKGHNENGWKRKAAMNGCGFTLHGPDWTKSAATTFDIGGCAGGAGKEIFIETPWCYVWIPPQEGKFAEVWSMGTNLEVYPQAVGLKYTVWCSGFKEKETRTDGKLSVAWLVKATNAGKEDPLTVIPYPYLSVIGEGAAQKFHSGVYPVGLAGEQIGGEVGGKSVEKLELGTGAGVVKCTPVKFSLSSMTKDVSELTMSVAQYGSGAIGCTFGGLPGVTVTPETGCKFTFSVSGQLSTCKFTVTRESCVMTVPAQANSGLTLANVGTGGAAYVKATVNVSGLQYQIAGSGCPKEIAPGSYSDGTYKGIVKLNVSSF